MKGKVGGEGGGVSLVAYIQRTAHNVLKDLYIGLSAIGFGLIQSLIVSL